MTLQDVVVLARYHQCLKADGIEHLPLLNTLPSFQKLDNHSLTPELSLQILKESEQELADTLAFFRD